LTSIAPSGPTRYTVVPAADQPPLDPHPPEEPPLEPQPPDDPPEEPPLDPWGAHPPLDPQPPDDPWL
jgi:hypothetical protein